MNLLENYIKKIHEIKEVEYEGRSYILADVTVDCYGSISRTKTSFRNWREWEEVKEKGYYMG